MKGAPNRSPGRTNSLISNTSTGSLNDGDSDDEDDEDDYDDEGEEGEEKEILYTICFLVYTKGNTVLKSI